jgi:hypothetical protein
MSHEIITNERYLGFRASKEPKLTGEEQRQYINVIEKKAIECLIS